VKKDEEKGAVLNSNIKNEAQAKKEVQILK